MFVYMVANMVVYIVVHMVVHMVHGCAAQIIRERRSGWSMVGWVGGMSTVAGNISEVENISGGKIAEVEAGLAMLALESFLSGEELMVWLAISL